MMEEATGDVEFDPAQVQAAFAELDGLRKRAWPEHLHRAEGAAAVQPQRLLGSLGAARSGLRATGEDQLLLRRASAMAFLSAS